MIVSKIFGIIYIVVNTIIFLTLLALALNGPGNFLPLYLEWIVLIFPIVGILSGYWISSGQLGTKKLLIVILSLFFTFATIFVALVVLPLVERANVENNSKLHVNSNHICHFQHMTNYTT